MSHAVSTSRLAYNHPWKSLNVWERKEQNNEAYAREEEIEREGGGALEYFDCGYRAQMFSCLPKENPTFNSQMHAKEKLRSFAKLVYHPLHNLVHPPAQPTHSNTPTPSEVYKTFTQSKVGLWSVLTNRGRFTRNTQPRSGMMGNKQRSRNVKAWIFLTSTFMLLDKAGDLKL